MEANYTDLLLLCLLERLDENVPDFAILDTRKIAGTAAVARNLEAVEQTFLFVPELDVARNADQLGKVDVPHRRIADRQVAL